jgi:squalene-hopene/tetraprenyl-beta-curcumene cyclase
MGNHANTAATEAAVEQVRSVLDEVIEEATGWLADRQAKDGHWLFELEADATIPAEYILLNHYLGDIDDAVEGKLANYLRRRQGKHGGWPLYHDGDFDISATVKAYFALKLVGDDPNAPHMARARDAVLAHGGAAKANVFTRITLALFGEVPWRAVPWMRPEAMLLPKWSPFHIDKVSYWSRTVMVPLLVLAALKPQARNPRGKGIAELFVVPPEKQKRYLRNPTGHRLGDILLLVDRIGRFCDPLFPAFLEKKAIDRAMEFVRERFNGEDGLGGIFPAMANAVMALDALGCSRDHPEFVTARRAIDKLIVISNGEGYCQPCLSPVWDTGLALHSMLEAGLEPDHPVVTRATEWLRERQVLDVDGDYKSTRDGIRPGGWAFQYWNDHYPDVDDTAVVVMGLDRVGDPRTREAVARGTEWVIGMQSKNGGWGAFDADNEHYFLENIPFADHGALLDPPTADVTARCLSMLAQLGYQHDHPTVAKGLKYLEQEQEENGSWFGRWGTNYIYGTWSVLCALNAIGEDMNAPYVQKAVEWLKSQQRDDGGWGEDCASYWPDQVQEAKISTPSQTAWAVLGLMAAGKVDSDPVRRGIDYLLTAPRDGGKWREEYYNAVGFPKVFYLSYHGYSAYFPLWALARYRNLCQSNATATMYGM